MMWHMRGSISLNEVFELEPQDREIIAKLIKDNMEATKKSGMPFF